MAVVDLRSISLRFVDAARALLRPDSLLLLFAIVLFSVLPQLDLWVSMPFFDPLHAQFAADRQWARLIYLGTGWLAKIGGAALLLALLPALCFPARREARRTQRKAGFVLLALLLGPGLLINEGFKEHWGRARPRDVLFFGGHAQFTAATLPAAQCGSNCSFVSGHAAVGFALMAFAWVTRRRRLWLAIGLGAGTLIGVARVAVGGHFLSDVIFSGFVVWFSLQLVARLFVRISAHRRRRARRQLPPALAVAELAG